MTNTQVLPTLKVVDKRVLTTDLFAAQKRWPDFYAETCGVDTPEFHFKLPKGPLPKTIRPIVEHPEVGISEMVHRLRDFMEVEININLAEICQISISDVSISWTHVSSEPDDVKVRIPKPNFDQTLMIHTTQLTYDCWLARKVLELNRNHHVPTQHNVCRATLCSTLTKNGCFVVVNHCNGKVQIDTLEGFKKMNPNKKASVRKMYKA